MDIKENDLQTREYLKDNFSVSKSEIPFTSIESDHAMMKQENKGLKVSSGVIGLMKKSSALNHFLLTAPILNAVFDKFWKKVWSPGLLNEKIPLSTHWFTLKQALWKRKKINSRNR